MGAYLNSQITTKEIFKDKLQSDISSGFVLFCNQQGVVDYDSIKTVDLFGDNQSLVEISKHRYGVFDIVTVQNKWKNISFKKTALLGENIFEGEKTALYLTDRQRYLSVSGNTIISGTSYLPKLGIRRAYIEGKGFKGDNLVEGEIKNSNNSLPTIDTNIINYLYGFFEDKYPSSDSIAGYEDMVRTKSVIRKFSEKQLMLISKEIIKVTGTVIEGNVIVYSPKGVFIGKDANIKDAIFFAPNIYIEPGFNGSIQAFAQDTFVVGDDCKLRYPSYVAIINKNINNCYFRVEEGSEIAGGILIYQDSKALKEPELFIGKDVSIYGQVYCKGSCELKGNIYGSLYCNVFVLKTPSAYYENHLLDVKIDINNLSKYFVGATIFDKSTKSKKIIRWLE